MYLRRHSQLTLLKKYVLHKIFWSCHKGKQFTKVCYELVDQWNYQALSRVQDNANFIKYASRKFLELYILESWIKCRFRSWSPYLPWILIWWFLIKMPLNNVELNIFMHLINGVSNDFFCNNQIVAWRHWVWLSLRKTYKSYIRVHCSVSLYLSPFPPVSLFLSTSPFVLPSLVFSLPLP